MTYKIWIIGRGIYAFNLIRSLNNKYIINLITTNKYDFASYSNKINKVIYIEYINEYDYINKIKEIVKDDLIIPVGEEYILLENYINKTGCNLNLYLLDKQNNKYKYHNKKEFNNLLNNIGLPTLDVQEYIDNNKYILKLIYSRGGVGNLIKYGYEIKNIDMNNYLIQEYIKYEKEYSVFCIVEDGNIKSILIYEILMMFNGYSIKRKLVINDKLVEYTNKIVKNINYTGFLGLDCLLYKNEYYIVDFNPRITNGISFYLKDSLNIENKIDKNKINKKKEIIISILNYKEILKYNNDILYLDDIKPFIICIIVYIYKYIYYKIKKLDYNKCLIDEMILVN